MNENKGKKFESFKESIPEDVRDHMKSAREELRQSMEAVMPPGFVEHRRKARKEMLLAFRGMLDHAIAHIDEKTKTA